MLVLVEDQVFVQVVYLPDKGGKCEEFHELGEKYFLDHNADSEKTEYRSFETKWGDLK